MRRVQRFIGSTVTKHFRQVKKPTRPVVVQFQLSPAVRQFLRCSKHGPKRRCTIYGLKAGGLVFASRFILIVFAVSSCTNSTARLRWSTLGLVVSILGLCIAFLILGGLGFFAVGSSRGWLLIPPAILDAYALFRIYAWFHNRGGFDLMSFPRQ